MLRVKPMIRASIRPVIAAICIAGSTLLDAQNLVPNGGFESGLTGWSNNASSGAIASFSLESTQPYAGAKAIKIVVNTLGPNAWNVQTLGPTFTDIGSNRSTMITFRARAATAGTRVRFVMQTNVYKNQDFTLSTAWTYFSWNHTTAETSPRLRIQYPDQGTVWLDEILVVAHDEPASGILPITLNPGARRQTMEGIGGALTWYSTRVLSSPHKDQLEGLIFDDLGLDIIRLKNWYFPADYPNNKSPGNIPTTNNQRSSYNANKTFYDMAKEGDRDISVLLSSWTPPPILKTNNSLGGTDSNGTLNATLKKVNGQFVYADLAQYWVDLLDNMNWTPDYLSVQNEPGYLATWESCEYAPNQTSTLPGYAQALDAIHNRIKDRPGLPVLLGPDSENMNDFLTQAAPLASRPYVGIYGFHNYNIGSTTAIDGEISKLNQIRDDFDDRPNWMTEFSKGDFDWLETARVIHNTLVEANSSAYIFWKLVWGESTSIDEIMINIDGAGNYVVGPTYYAIKHYAKHISRGYQRFDVTGSNTNVRASGYLSPDGRKVTLVIINTGGAPTGISLRLGGLLQGRGHIFHAHPEDCHE